MKKIVIAGCGYVGTRVTRIWKKTSAEVTCLVRSPEHQAALVSEGFTTRSCSFDDPADIPALNVAGCIVYYLVPPPGGGIADTRSRNFIEVLKRS